MTVALTALGSGALHALTGPDHLVSLAPLSAGRPAGWKVGLLWGLGHAAGTLLLAALLLLAASQVTLASATVWAERIAGLALAGMGAYGLRALRPGPAPSAAGSRAPWKALAAMGFVHGATGAAGLLLLLPAAASASPAHQVVYLGCFAVGSTLAMAALTQLLASAARWRRAEELARRAPAVAAVGALVLGLVWTATA